MAKRIIDFTEAQAKVKQWIYTLDGSDMERLMADAFSCHNVEYLPDEDSLSYDPDKDHDDFFYPRWEDMDVPQELCPACKTGNIANEDGPDENNRLPVICHECGHQWTEPVAEDVTIE